MVLLMIVQDTDSLARERAADCLTLIGRKAKRGQEDFERWRSDNFAWFAARHKCLCQVNQLSQVIKSRQTVILCMCRYTKMEELQLTASCQLAMCHAHMTADQFH